MKAICYHNTKITLTYWAPNSRLNEECPLGFAYEDGDFYVHMYGREKTSISSGNIFKILLNTRGLKGTFLCMFYWGGSIW